MTGISLQEILNETAKKTKGTTYSSGGEGFSILFGDFVSKEQQQPENMVVKAEVPKDKAEKAIDKLDIPKKEKEKLLSKYKEIDTPEDAKEFIQSVKETAEEYGVAAPGVIREIAQVIAEEMKLSGASPEDLLSMLEESGAFDEGGELSEELTKLLESISSSGKDDDGTEIVFSLIKTETVNTAGKDIYNAVSIRAGDTQASGQRTTVVQNVKVKDPNGILKIADAIALTKNNGEKKLTLQLYPRALGQVNIELIESNGKLSAKIMFEKDTARWMLHGQAEQLKQVLEEKGIVIESMEFLFADLNQKDQASEQSFFNKKGKGGSSGQDANLAEQGNDRGLYA